MSPSFFPEGDSYIARILALVAEGCEFARLHCSTLHQVTDGASARTWGVAFERGLVCLLVYVVFVLVSQTQMLSRVWDGERWILHPEVTGYLSEARAVLLAYATCEWYWCLPLISSGVAHLLVTLPHGVTLGDAIMRGQVPPSGLAGLSHLSAQAPSPRVAAPYSMPLAVFDDPSVRAVGPSSVLPSERPLLESFPLLRKAVRELQESRSILNKVAGRVGRLKERRDEELRAVAQTLRALQEEEEELNGVSKRYTLARDTAAQFPVTFVGCTGVGDSVAACARDQETSTSVDNCDGGDDDSETLVDRGGDSV